VGACDCTYKAMDLMVRRNTPAVGRLIFGVEYWWREIVLFWVLDRDKSFVVCGRTQSFSWRL
jgi:hypothetical protein